jgi:SAM-dependent methyltransferase
LAPSTDTESVQRAINDARWQDSRRVATYASRTLRPVEVLILVRYRDALRGRILELGSGAGRLTGYLVAIATTVLGLDLSAEMVAFSQAHYPAAQFIRADLRDLSGIETASWDAVVAGYNVIDVLSDGERGGVLDEVHRVLAPGGLFVMSSHNLDAAHRVTESFKVRGRGVGDAIATLISLPGWVWNRRRMRRFERREPGYAILNDAANDFTALHYYITRDRQEAQLRDHGFEVVEVLDLDGEPVPAGATSSSPELHYLARPVA